MPMLMSPYSQESLGEELTEWPQWLKTRMIGGPLGRRRLIQWAVEGDSALQSPFSVLTHPFRGQSMGRKEVDAGRREKKSIIRRLMPIAGPALHKPGRERNWGFVAWPGTRVSWY